MKNFSTPINIGLITGPLPEVKGSHILVENFLQVLEPIANEIYLITSNYPKNTISNSSIHVNNIKSDSKRQSILIRTVKYLVRRQLKTTICLINMSKKVNTVIFFLDGSLVLPMLIAKMLRKKTIIVVTGSHEKVTEKCYQKTLFGKGGFIPSRMMLFLEVSNYKFADSIIVYSSSVINQLRLKNFRDKIFTMGARFVDRNYFKQNRSLVNRKKLVGYVGRLSEEKGYMNFINSIPLILRQQNDIRFLVCGEGVKGKSIEIRKKLETETYGSKVFYMGWIPHEKLSEYLNQLTLLVNPSYTDTGPQIVLEAMACGTPILSSLVGMVPDLIKDGENGFIMNDNSPECIAKNVTRVLDNPNLEHITKKALAIIEKEYSYEAAVKRYTEIFRQIFKRK